MTRRTAALFALASVAWGVPYLLAALALEDFSAVFVVWARALLGAAILLPLAWRRGELRALRGRGRALGGLALLDLTLPTLLVTLGVAAIPSSLAGTIMAAVPILVVLLALRFDPGERPDRLRVLGLVVGIGGVALLLGVEVRGDARALLGAALVLAGAASYAGGALVYQRRFADRPPLGVLGVALALSAAMTTVPTAFALPGAAPSLQGALALATLGLGCTAGGYLLFYRLIATIGASRAAVITYVAPTIAVGAGVLVLDEPLTAAVVAGLLLILAGSWLSTGGSPPTPRAAVPARLALTPP